MAPDSSIIDISTPIYPGMPLWPGTADTGIKLVSTVEADGVNVSRLDIDAHAGSHAEGSLHHYAKGTPVSDLSLDTLNGQAYVAYLPDASAIGPEELEAAHIPGDTSRLLLKTKNSLLWRVKGRPFQPDYVALTAEGAEWVVARGVKLVGIDYLSIGRYHADGRQTHQALLSAGVIVVESLDLDAVEPGEYELICLPLNIEGVEAAPARAALRKRGDDE